MKPDADGRRSMRRERGDESLPDFPDDAAKDVTDAPMKTVGDASTKITGQRAPAVSRRLSSVLGRSLGWATHALWVRAHGDYKVDAFGRDEQVCAALRPLQKVWFHQYWRCRVDGGEHLPSAGPALIVANRSGFMPWDGEVLRFAVMEILHDRVPRILDGGRSGALPFIGTAYLKTGRLFQCPDNARSLLTGGEVVIAFPEGAGAGWRTRRDRYRVGTFVDTWLFEVACELRVPVIPAAVIGAEKAYPLLATLPLPGRPFGFSHLPITPVFPLLPPPLCFMAFPASWRISFGEPFQFDPERDAGVDAGALRLSEQSRKSVRTGILRFLKE
ncbi:1-acyl-sn-glycerol-3-phosphate acyltransferase [bacterium]|nr:1-acyl-sn-glycerol-3-phosphate acyltransferase [candidate division CSSED10-310 bacterium]